MNDMEINDKVYILSKTAGSYFYPKMREYGYEPVKMILNYERKTVYIGYYKGKNSKGEALLWKRIEDGSSSGFGGDSFNFSDFLSAKSVIVDAILPEELFDI